MPKININGITREMTAEEIAEMERITADMQEPPISLEDQIIELQEALNLLLLGVTE